MYHVYQVYQVHQKDQDQISGATYISDVVFSQYTQICLTKNYVSIYFQLSQIFLTKNYQ